MILQFFLWFPPHLSGLFPSLFSCNERFEWKLSMAIELIDQCLTV